MQPFAAYVKRGKMQPFVNFDFYSAKLSIRFHATNFTGKKIRLQKAAFFPFWRRLQKAAYFKRLKINIGCKRLHVAFIATPGIRTERVPKKCLHYIIFINRFSLFQKKTLVYNESAGTSGLLLFWGLRLPIQDNKHFPRAHGVYMVDIYNKDTGVQMFIIPCIEIVEVSE